MNLDLSTQLWMLGVIALGVVFYGIAIRYSKHSNDE
jgi:hypothetical protein